MDKQSSDEGSQPLRGQAVGVTLTTGGAREYMREWYGYEPSRETIRRWCARQVLEAATTPGGQWVITTEAIDRLMERHGHTKKSA